MSKGTKVFLGIFFMLIIVLAILVTIFAIKYLDINKEKTDVAINNQGKEEQEPKYYEPTEEETKRAKDLEKILKSNLPVIDGSTSTIPLEGGIRAALFDVSQENAEAGIVHSTTYGSFDNLLEGKCDIIFSTPLSEEQYRKAKEAKAELVETPVVYEGFVFVVNAKNPVDTLTQQQLKDIYSGKITNWKEVGGNDAEIVAYQRNETSGSQNYMKEFMKDSELMKPVTTFTPASMVGLMDAIATYDNAENAIGYSVYAYAANMYGNGNEIKFIKVDGVDPTKETMATQEYPLLNYNYAIYNEKSEATTTVDELVEWLLTYDGQVAMVNAGYVPIKNIQVKELEVEVYTSKGTSREEKSDSKDDFYYSVEPHELTDLTDTEWWNRKGEGAKITKLKNKELQEEINKFIEESVQKLKEKEDECQNYVDLLNNYSEFRYENIGIRTELNCINGYLSVQVLLNYELVVQQGFRYTYAGYSRIYDLVNGKELALSDLFYENEDFVNEINKQIKWRIPYEVELSVLPIEEKHSFATLPKEGYSVGIKEEYNNVYISLIFDKENPYFVEGVEFEINTYLDNISCINKTRDMSGLFEIGVKQEKQMYLNYFKTKPAQKVTSQNEYNIYYMDSGNTKIDNIINKYIDEEIVNDEKIEELMNKFFEEREEVVYFWKTDDGKNLIEIGASLNGNRYIEIMITCGMENIDFIYFDEKTGNQVSESEFTKWEEANFGLD